MAFQFTNFAESTLASGMTAGQTTATVAASDGGLFPATGDFQLVIIRDSDGAREIVKGTSRTGDVITVTRAQESTTGLIFVAGDKIELRVTAAILNSYVSSIIDIDQVATSVNSAVHSEAAHATTSDIWAGGQVCLLTGSAVVFTALAAAPQAGAWRIVVANAIHTFTDGATFECDGNADYKCNLNDVLLITAKTTTTFRVNVLASGTGYPTVPLQQYVAGCDISPAGASATMPIAAGQVVDSTGKKAFKIAALNKTTGAWAVGDSNGGLDTGTIAADTPYHIFAIYRSDTGVSDYLFSLSATSPTMPSDYDYKKRIGAWITDSSSQWYKGHSRGDYFYYDLGITDSFLTDAYTNQGTSANTRTLPVPTGAILYWFGTLTINTFGTSCSVLLTSLTDTDVAPTNTINMVHVDFISGTARFSGSAVSEVETNTSAQIRTRHSTSDGNTIMTLNTRGWRDPRTA